MRVTFKVAAAPFDMKDQTGDVIIHPIRRAPYGAQNEMEQSWMDEVLERYDRLLKANEREQQGMITPLMVRRTNRAARYDAWCYLRYEVRTESGGTFGKRVVNELTIDNVNRLEGQPWEMVRRAAVDCARFVAHIIVALVDKTREKDPRFPEVFVWDRACPFFKWAEEEDAKWKAESERRS